MSHAAKAQAEVGRSGVPVVQAFFFVGVFFILMLLFNGVAMCESAKQLEYGKARDFWVAVLQPVAWSSRVSGLYHLRALPQESVGKRFNQPKK